MIQGSGLNCLALAEYRQWHPSEQTLLRVFSMSTRQVFYVATSLEDRRPYFRSDINSDWWKTAPYRVQIRRKDALKWDYYDCNSGFDGLISVRAAEILRPYLSPCFALVDAFVNDTPYFLLKPIGTIDCLDRDKSVFIPYPERPWTNLGVEQYVFRKEIIPDPCLFKIPDHRGFMFGTDGIPEVIRANKLRGFRAIDVEIHGVKPDFLKGPTCFRPPL